MPKTLKFNYAAVITGLLLVLGILWNYQAGWTARGPAMETVQRGTLKHEKTVRAVFANTETVLLAPEEGRVTPVHADGERYKKGETVAHIQPVGVNQNGAKNLVAVAAPGSGLFYQDWDGLEQTLTPENLLNMNIKELLSQLDNTSGKTAGIGGAGSGAAGPDSGIVSKFLPLGKIVNNLYPSWMFVYLDDTGKLLKGDNVKFIIEGEEYSGTVMKISGDPGGAVVRFNQYVKGTTEKRNRKIIWKYKASSQGLLVPYSALYVSGEERGVFTGEEGTIQYRNVKVIDSNENQACVEGIPEGAKVVVNPRKGIEGLTYRTET